MILLTSKKSLSIALSVTLIWSELALACPGLTALSLRPRPLGEDQVEVDYQQIILEPVIAALRAIPSEGEGSIPHVKLEELISKDLGRLVDLCMRESSAVECKKQSLKILGRYGLRLKQAETVIRCFDAVKPPDFKVQSINFASLPVIVGGSSYISMNRAVFVRAYDLLQDCIAARRTGNPEDLLLEPFGPQDKQLRDDLRQRAKEISNPGTAVVGFLLDENSKGSLIYLINLFFDDPRGRRILERIWGPEADFGKWERLTRFYLSLNAASLNRQEMTNTNFAIGLIDSYIILAYILAPLALLLQDREYLDQLERAQQRLRASPFAIPPDSVVIPATSHLNFYAGLCTIPHELQVARSRTDQAIIGGAISSAGAKPRYLASEASVNKKAFAHYRFPRDLCSFAACRGLMITHATKGTHTRISEGGNVVDGVGNNGEPFNFISRAVPDKEAAQLQMACKRLGKPVTIVRLPPGFSRARRAGREIIIECPCHIDLSVGYVPAFVTTDNKSRILFDPLYYEGIRSPGLERSLKRLGFGIEDGTIVLVDQSETHLNPANLDILPNGKIIINTAPRTIAALKIKPEKLICPEAPIERSAYGVAGIRCIVGYDMSSLSAADITKDGRPPNPTTLLGNLVCMYMSGMFGFKATFTPAGGEYETSITDTDTGQGASLTIGDPEYHDGSMLEGCALRNSDSSI